LKTRGLRGSVLEEMINRTIEEYRIKNLALIQKIPTPITPIKMDKEGHITLAYFDKKSTVDYVGVVQEIPVCFDAKECKTKKFPIANVHRHQVEFMHDWEKQGGIAFILILFIEQNLAYYMRYKELKKYFDDKNSFSISELDEKYFINMNRKIKIDILSKIQLDIDER